MILILESALCLPFVIQTRSQGNINLICGKETFLSAVQAEITQMQMKRTNFSLSLFFNRKHANPEKNLLLFTQPFYDVVRLILDSGGGAGFAVLFFLRPHHCTNINFITYHTTMLSPHCRVKNLSLRQVYTGYSRPLKLIQVS